MILTIAVSVELLVFAHTLAFLTCKLHWCIYFEDLLLKRNIIKHKETSHNPLKAGRICDKIRKIFHAD